MSFAPSISRAAKPAGAVRPERRTAIELAPVALLTVCALALRLSQIDQSLVGDEVYTYQDVVGRSLHAVVTTVHTGGENSPPLFFVLAWASAKLGDPSIWIRLPSLLLGSATVPLVYGIGRRVSGQVAGLIAAGIIALAPFAVYYGIEARPYATMAFFVAASTLALLEAVASRSRLWWTLYCLSAAAAAYTHYTSVFVLAVQAVWSLWACRDRFRQPVAANIAIAILLVPWLPHVRGKLLGVIGSLYPLGVRRVVTDLLRPIPGHPAAPLSVIPTVPGLIAFAVCVIGGLGALWQRSRARTDGRSSSELALIVALTAATPIGLLLYSLLVTDLWLPRGLSASMPAAAVLIGAALAAMPRRLTVVAAVVCGVTLAAGTIRSFAPAYTRGPYRAIATYLDRVAGPRDPVGVVSFTGWPALRAQFHSAHPVTSSLPTVWRLTPSGHMAYVVLDNEIARLLHIATPHPRGFRLIARRHYAGNFATDVLAYRRN
jgi:mannosyltransferase